MSICVPAVFTRHHRKDPPLHLNAPDPGVESLLRQRVMRRPIMQTAVRHKASSRTPPSPLFPTSLDHPESGMQNVVLWHVLLCACFSRTSPPLRPTPPPGGREASASARHAATHHAAGQAVRHIKGFLAQTSITPLPYHASAS